MSPAPPGGQGSRRPGEQEFQAHLPNLQVLQADLLRRRRLVSVTQLGGHDPGWLNLSWQGRCRNTKLEKGASGSADCLQSPGDQGLGILGRMGTENGDNNAAGQAWLGWGHFSLISTINLLFPSSSGGSGREFSCRIRPGWVMNFPTPQCQHHSPWFFHNMNLGDVAKLREKITLKERA